MITVNRFHKSFLSMLFVCVCMKAVTLHVHACARGLLVLESAGNAVELSVTAQKRACLVVRKANARRGAILPDPLDPCEIANACVVARLTARRNLLDQRAIQIGAQVDLAQQRLADDHAAVDR